MYSTPKQAAASSMRAKKESIAQRRVPRFVQLYCCNDMNQNQAKREQQSSKTDNNKTTQQAKKATPNTQVHAPGKHITFEQRTTKTPNTFP